MTRKRAAELWPIIKAYGEGEEIEACYIGNRTFSRLGPDHDWDTGYEYRIKPEPKKRPMTRGEVLFIVTTTPGMVIRGVEWEGGFPEPSQRITEWLEDYDDVSDYEYAIIDKYGEPVDGWHKFEKEVSE